MDSKESVLNNYMKKKTLLSHYQISEIMQQLCTHEQRFVLQFLLNWVSYKKIKKKTDLFFQAKELNVIL